MRSNRGFTIIELLVVVSIITLLVGILLPAIGKARDVGMVTESASNVRNLSFAHFQYAIDSNDHQFSLIDNNISNYGNTLGSALAGYEQSTGLPHPLVFLGWGPAQAGGAGNFHWYLDSAGGAAYQPISFTQDSGSGGERFGSFRLLNVEAFHHYVGGRFYDPMFYAPKDRVVMSTVVDGFECPHSFQAQGYGNLEWSSYCLSPAAMFHPQVLRLPSEGGFQNPWLIPAGFRSPSMAQVRYGSLKTHLTEHHWLQGPPPMDCSPSFDGGTYDGCEPYYYNHGWTSSPVTAFYDGHAEQVGVGEAMRADGRMMAQSGGVDGLWSRDTSWEEDGYFISYAYDLTDTSFHTFTTQGILGRDILSE